MPLHTLSSDEISDLVTSSESWLSDLETRLRSGQPLVDIDGHEVALHRLWRALFRRGRALAEHGQTELARKLYQFAENNCAEGE